MPVGKGLRAVQSTMKCVESNQNRRINGPSNLESVMGKVARVVTT